MRAAAAAAAAAADCCVVHAVLMQLPKPSLGRELGSPPADGISNVRFSNHSDHLLVASWDSNLRLYDAGANTLRGTFPRRGPVLDCCFHDDSSGFAGSADQSVVRYDFNVGREDVLGHHQGAVKCVEYSHATGQLITGGWDRTVRCWDPRAPASHLRLTVTAEQPERCYSMSLAAHRLVVAMAGRHVSIYDLRNMSQPEQRRESSLKFQTRCVRCYPTGTGYALASVEGRVAMEFFDPSETAQAKKYAFKCHRRSEGGRDTVFPVNAIAFHPIYGTFATGGCDGVVNIWDGNNKKRLYQYAKYPTSIAALSFSRDGRLLAVAASYTFEMGDIPHERDAIHIRNVNDAEVKPKPKAYSTATQQSAINRSALLQATPSRNHLDFTMRSRYGHNQIVKLLLLGAFLLAAQPSNAGCESVWRNLNRAWRNGGENAHLAAPSRDNSGEFFTPTADGSAVYIVRLNAAPPLCEYRGGIAGYPATATWDDGSDEEDSDAVPQMILPAEDTAAATGGETVDLDDTDGDQLLSNATAPSLPANGTSDAAATPSARGGHSGSGNGGSVRGAAAAAAGTGGI
ncbi:unnamed protein product [Closterium sp. NIES-54]